MMCLNVTWFGLKTNKFVLNMTTFLNITALVLSITWFFLKLLVAGRADLYLNFMGNGFPCSHSSAPLPNMTGCGPYVTLM